jgi:hypothetical protein
MSERMTSVHLPSLGHGSGLAHYGRQEPQVMIRRMRRNAEIAKEDAERILAAADEDFVVETYLGVHVQKKREVIWPKEATDE